MRRHKKLEDGDTNITFPTSTIMNQHHNFPFQTSMAFKAIRNSYHEFLYVEIYTLPRIKRGKQPTAIFQAHLRVLPHSINSFWSWELGTVRRSCYLFISVTIRVWVSGRLLPEQDISKKQYTQRLRRLEYRVPLQLAPQPPVLTIMIFPI